MPLIIAAKCFSLFHDFNISFPHPCNPSPPRQTRHGILRSEILVLIYVPGCALLILRTPSELTIGFLSVATWRTRRGLITRNANSIHRACHYRRTNYTRCFFNVALSSLMGSFPLVHNMSFTSLTFADLTRIVLNALRNSSPVFREREFEQPCVNYES